MLWNITTRELSKTYQITIKQLQAECVLTLWTSHNLRTVHREVYRHLTSEISHNMPVTQNIFLHKSEREREALWRQRKQERSHSFSCMCKGEMPSIHKFSSSHVWETTRHFVIESLWLLMFPGNPYCIHQLTILFPLKTLRKLSLTKLNMKFNLKISTFQSDFCFCHACI